MMIGCCEAMLLVIKVVRYVVCLSAFEKWRMIKKGGMSGLRMEGEIPHTLLAFSHTPSLPG